MSQLYKSIKLNLKTSIVSVIFGIFVTLLSCLYLGIYPSLLIVVSVVILALICLVLGRFFLLGICFGIISIGVNTHPPYANEFHNCQYQASIVKANYSQQSLGKTVQLRASNIICDDEQPLRNQTIQLRDYQRELSPYISKTLFIESDLLPVHSRLNLGEMDYEKYLISEGIYLEAKKISIIESVSEKSPILIIRNSFAKNINQHLSPNNAAIILALVTGNRSALNTQQKNIMKQTGTTHILAISGLHLALVGGLVWMLVQGLWALSLRLSDKIMPIQAGAIAALLAITAYAELTGFDLPVKRAWVMFSLMIVSWLFLKSVAENSLLLALVVVMLVEPYSVVSVGFYFSFIATYIVLWSARLSYPPLIKICVMQMLISLVLFPIVWFSFGVIPLASLLVNLLIVPWLGVFVLPLAILACLLPSVSFLWTILDFTTSSLWQTIVFFEHLHLSVEPDCRPAFISVMIVVLAMLLALIVKKNWFLIGVLALFLPLRFPNNPEILIADQKYTSVLVHNAKEAMIINPGRKYHHINQAEKWQRYLTDHHLTLSVIVLSDDKISHISATKWLLDKYPKAKVITLEKMDLPYQSNYCQDFKTDHLSLMVSEDGDCHAKLNWFETEFVLFKESDNAILSGAIIHWKNEIVSANKLGMLRLQHDDNNVELSGLRDRTRLWRLKK